MYFINDCRIVIINNTTSGGNDDIVIYDNNSAIIDKISYDASWYHDASKADGGWSIEAGRTKPYRRSRTSTSLGNKARCEYCAATFS